ncbi:S49 family peptidase [Pseudoxanthomonas sangjuensis]|uniref:SDH family Clp fold serine proteinase n=1 Tax=Pseudoxanthomonas sangjuensis TaxID=1503750 RepID=UPI0013916DAF|nr:S49 family peptidase [Pseudoxanthomonas sangjuensis]KAF1713699.1 serine protease [Pseudoxanthomonas sangjuensis]
MSNWSELVRELGQLGSGYDILRRKYTKDLADYTGRNVICYYSGWLQKPELGNLSAVNDNDKNGLMTAINGLDPKKGLDLVLHTPGGDTAATESIVDYLWSKFGKNVRCFVPQMAMSAGTMIACSTKEIWMGKHSSLGPVDPQFGSIPAHGVLEEFERAYKEIIEDPRTVPIWQPILAKYPPAFIGECKKAVDWSNSLVGQWLKRNMFSRRKNPEETIATILRELGDHSVNFAHNRHLSFDKCKEIGLRVVELESDQDLQDKVLSVHHIYYHTLSSTNAFKIIQNHDGSAFILQAQPQIVVGQMPNRPQQVDGQQPPQNSPRQVEPAPMEIDAERP